MKTTLQPEEAFIEIDRFKELAFQLSGYIKNAAKAKGVNDLYLPGEIEFLTERQRMESGIPLEKKVLEDLRKLAESLGAPTLN